MRNKLRKTISAVVAFLMVFAMFAGFGGENSIFPAITVHAVNTLGTGNVWQDGDQLYFCRVSKDNQWAEYTLTANVEDEVTTWTPSEKLYWDDKGEHKLVVNYPVTGYVWDWWYVPEDQSTLPNLKKADHMNAMWKGNPTTDSINLNLKHRLSMVTVTYTFASEFANEPDIAPEVYSNTQYMLFDINTLERRNVEWQEDHAIWVKPYQHEGENGEKKFTAIVSPDAYTAGDDFIRITVGDQVLTAKMKDDITFEEGAHYTFDLKVGKNKVEIETVTVNGNFPGGWNEEVNLNADAGVTVGAPDVGKTGWEDGDLLAFEFTSDKYGDFRNGVIYEEGAWSSTIYPTLDPMTYLENETPTVNAIYSPRYALGDTEDIIVGSLSDDIAIGACEFIKVGCTLSGKTITADFADATRDYSRLRIVAEPNQKLRVTVNNFLPAGSDTEMATRFYSLTADGKGNAYLYGTFAEGGKVEVRHNDSRNEDNTFLLLSEYTFTAPTEAGKSYALDATGTNATP